LQGLYQWVVSGGDADDILKQLSEVKDYGNADGKFLSDLLKDTIASAETLRTLLEPLLDRPIKELSPVEHALLLLAACELESRPETPYRVIINEAVELAKSFGGTDGHKYVNGVLDRLAAASRADEVAARRATR
jgi:N utilization substance protein B